MSRTLILVVGLVLLLAVLAAAGSLAVCRQRVRVVEAFSNAPLSGAYISVDRAAGPALEVGQTDEQGELVFWISPLPWPLRICAQHTFHPPACVPAVGFSWKVVELAVP